MYKISIKISSDKSVKITLTPSKQKAASKVVIQTKEKNENVVYTKKN